MAAAGADIVVCHMGLTTGGAIGATTALTLADCVGADQRLGGARAVRKPDVLVLCHGGPIADAGRCKMDPLALPRNCHGFYGASSMERLPTEAAALGHSRHNHPGAEEIIFVISGNGEQMVEDPRAIR
jgi:predicted TIM-barrel enzyme